MTEENAYEVASEQILQHIKSAWGLVPKKSPGSIYFMWRQEKLHSVAIIGVRQTSGIHVPMIHWHMMRGLGERFNVPTSAYFLDASGGVYYASWPTISGMGYPTLPDDKLGGVVSITTPDFKLVETKKS